ncbi:MAG: hypothetical protein ACRDIC_06145 [bacterium]
MASEWETFCDAVALDLTTNVVSLRDALVHLYAPYDPEELVADPGEHHLSIFPVADSAQEAQPLTTDGGAEHIEIYRILYWEHAGDESVRGIADTEAARALLQLAQDTRDRFYKRANQFMANSTSVRYVGTAFPDRSGVIRWFAIGIRAKRAITLS